jgi:hypothetical protein
MTAPVTFSFPSRDAPTRANIILPQAALTEPQFQLNAAELHKPVTPPRPWPPFRPPGPVEPIRR